MSKLNAKDFVFVNRCDDITIILHHILAPYVLQFYYILHLSRRGLGHENYADKRSMFELESL